MKTINLRKFTKIGSSAYYLPMYELVEGEGLVELEDKTRCIGPLDFVKGGDNPHKGIVTEGLLSALIDHLNELNTGDLRNRHTSVVITKLEEALFWIEERKRDRANRGVSGTYNK